MSEMPKPNEGQDSHIEGAEESAKRFAVGVMKNPDGTLDYSQAMYAMGETHDRMAEQADASQAKIEADKRTKIENFDELIARYEGTPNSIFYQLSKTQFINRERADQGDERAAKLIRNLELQKTILGYIAPNFAGQDKGREPNQRIIDGIDALKTEWTQAIKDGQKSARYVAGVFDIDELWDASSELETKLLAEAEKSKARSATGETSSTSEQVKTEVTERIAKLEEIVAKRKAIYERAKQEGKPNTDVYWSKSIQPEIDVMGYLKQQNEAGIRSIDEILKQAEQRRDELSTKTGRVGVDLTQEEYDSLVTEERTLGRVVQLLG